MREIKFRGIVINFDTRKTWQVFQDGKPLWIYGHLLRQDVDTGRVFIREYNIENAPPRYTDYEVDPSTVGQYVQPYYVGHGKDRKDIGLWEGDIVSLKTDLDYLRSYEAVVRWGGPDYPAFDLFLRSEALKSGWEVLCHEWNSLSDDLEFEIIGNVHELANGKTTQP